MDRDTSIRVVELRAQDGTLRAVALIDAADVESVAANRWCLCNGYAVRSYRRPDGTRQLFGMHRQIMGLVPGDGLEVDHINGDKLDNRRSNLRVCEHAENQQNRSRGGYGASAHRGVSRHHASGKWQACVKLDGRTRHLGLFDDEAGASAAAAAFRAEHMPFSAEAAA